MTKEELYAFIAEQKTAFISSIDADGYPCTRAMLMPRKIDGNAIYFLPIRRRARLRSSVKTAKRACILQARQV